MVHEFGDRSRLMGWAALSALRLLDNNIEQLCTSSGLKLFVFFFGSVGALGLQHKNKEVTRSFTGIESWHVHFIT